jgi:hypothetical protein
MSKFIFITNPLNTREASKIEFEVPNDLTIFEFKNICIRMASAMGYHHNTILKAFETTREIEEIDKEIFNIFNNLGNYKQSNTSITTGSFSYNSL